jgi:hypothetical protein
MGNSYYYYYYYYVYRVRPTGEVVAEGGEHLLTEWAPLSL